VPYIVVLVKLLQTQRPHLLRVTQHRVDPCISFFLVRLLPLSLTAVCPARVRFVFVMQDASVPILSPYRYFGIARRYITRADTSPSARTHACCVVDLNVTTSPLFVLTVPRITLSALCRCRHPVLPPSCASRYQRFNCASGSLRITRYAAPGAWSAAYPCQRFADCVMPT